MTDTTVVVQAPFVIPLTNSPSQTVQATLGGQVCVINIFTKSINVSYQLPDTITVTPPAYENQNPVFIDLYLDGPLGLIPVVTGVLLLNQNWVVRDVYFGFIGDLTIIDTTGAGADPFGVSYRLPPSDLRNWWQKLLPLSLGGLAPPNMAGTIPGLGSRFILAYWPSAASTYWPLQILAT